MRTIHLFVFVAFTQALVAQSVSPSVIASFGGSAVVSGVTIEHTVGEVAVATLQGTDLRLTQGLHQAEPVRLRANIRAMLQGPFDQVSGLMIDDLRSLGLVPLMEPYTAMNLPQFGTGGEVTSPAVLAVTGSNAVIDWVHLQLRDKNNATAILATCNALLQADGDIVDVDGTSPLRFAAPADDYFISVHHRNHLGMMSLSPIALSNTAPPIDFTDGSVATYGIEAQAMVGAVHVLWCGDVNADGNLLYVGFPNDRDPMLMAIGGSVPTNTASGYLPTDVNLDGVTRYVGFPNDRDFILENIGGSVPTNVRQGQLP